MESEKGFSLVEFLISLVILTLVGIALLNSIVFFLNKKLQTAIASHTADAAKNLVAYPEKLENCMGVEACDAFDDAACQSSISCDENYCTASDKCVVCYTNPENGKKFFYSFNSSLVESGTDYRIYKVKMCWKLNREQEEINPIFITVQNGTTP